MQEQATGKEELEFIKDLKESGLKAGSFRYYLHDNSDAFRFQLIGQFTSAALVEMDGCWRTARSSMGGRKVRLDLREVTSVDETARIWLKKLVAEDGAECVVAAASFSELLGNELGSGCQTVNVSDGALSFRKRLGRCLRSRLFRKGTGRKAGDPSLALARCR